MHIRRPLSDDEDEGTIGATPADPGPRLRPPPPTSRNTSSSISLTPISPVDENTSDEDDTHFTLKKSIDPSKFTHLFQLGPKLTATNYATWTSIVLRSLQAVTLHVYLSLDFTIPQGNTSYTKHHPVRWQKANLFVCSILTATMSEEIQNQIGDLPTAAEMWAGARRLYGSTTATDWTLSITSLVTTRYTDGDDVAAHISKMKGYRRDLALMQRDIDDELFACFLRISMPSTWDSVFAALPDHYTSSEVERRVRDEYAVHTSQSTASSFHATSSKTSESAQRSGARARRGAAAVEEARKEAQPEQEAEEPARLPSQAKTSAAPMAARSDEYQHLKANVEKKKKLEKKLEKKEKKLEKRRKKEAEIRLREEAEAAERDAEEERLRVEAERREEEEAEALRKREEEERLAEQCRKRELERAAAAEKARKKAQREQEVEKRAQLRSQAARTSTATTAPEARVWRHLSAQTSSAPARRAQSPAPATGSPKIGFAPGGWRQRMAEKEKQGAPGAPVTSATSSPVTTSAPLPEVKKYVDGFETVPAKWVWKPTRLRGKV